MDTDLHRLKEGSARLQSFPYLICVQSVLIRGDESYQISAVRGDEAIKLEKNQKPTVSNCDRADPGRLSPNCRFYR